MQLGYIPFNATDMPSRYGDQCRHLDWEKARKICEENPTSTIEAGLCEDWGYTSATIFENGQYFRDRDNSECGFYGLSRWATPVLVIDDGEPIECWYLSDDWDHPEIPENWGE